MSSGNPGVESGDVAYVTAGVDVRHKAAAADDGFSGIAIKTKTPAADTVRASRDLIVAGEAYTLLTTGVHAIPSTGLTGLVKGDLVYIVTADNTFATTAGGGKVVLGKVYSLAGERGTRSDQIKVDLSKKV